VYTTKGVFCEHPLRESFQKKWGAPSSTPLKDFKKNYRFFAAFFLAPLAAFFAIGLLSCRISSTASDDRMAVTIGGLSHPPSYQM
jgi:hypothetical protein